MSKSDNRAKAFKYSTAPEERKKERAARMKEIRALDKTKHQRQDRLPQGLIPEIYETDLHNWLVRTSTRQDHFADVIGCTRQSVRNWRFGVVIPSLVHAFRIEALTKGEVAVASWMETPAAKFVWNQCLSLARTPVK
jgi:DNA-binding transcriptional regulator YiaG